MALHPFVRLNRRRTLRQPQSRTSRNLRQILVGALMVFSGITMTAMASDRTMPPERRVPRYVSLASDTVNARANPGRTERLKWIYRVRGLPVQVVGEIDDWRRICDPEGQVSWIERRNLAPQWTAFNSSGRPVALRRRARTDAPISAYLAPRALVRLDRCEKGWCRVNVAGKTGWTKVGELWGTQDTPQCPPTFPLAQRQTLGAANGRLSSTAN